MKRPWHLHHSGTGEWGPLYDDAGVELVGVQGKEGVRAHKGDGTRIGCDLIRMQPGSAFPMHTHEGDHIIYVVSGWGFVHIDGRDIEIAEGDVVHIPAEHPHGVWAAGNELLFAAIGHPHHKVHSTKRMTIVKPGDDTARDNSN